MVQAHKDNSGASPNFSRCRSAKSSRQLLFDEDLQLCGRRAESDRGSPKSSGHRRAWSRLAFFPASMLSLSALAIDDVGRGRSSTIVTFFTCRIAGQGEKNPRIPGRSILLGRGPGSHSRPANRRKQDSVTKSRPSVAQIPIFAGAATVAKPSACMTGVVEGWAQLRHLFDFRALGFTRIS